MSLNKNEMKKFDALLDELMEDAQILFEGDLGWLEVLEFLDSAVHVAEDLITESGRCQDKKQMVLMVWEKAEKKYNLIERLDKAIKLPGLLEAVDGLALKWLIEVLIRVSVEKLWKEQAAK